MSSGSEPPEEERVWAAISWGLSIAGAALALALKPRSKHVAHWAYLSVAFFVILVACAAGLWALSLPLRLLRLGLLADALWALYWAAALIVWALGLLRSLAGARWRPPLIYDLARAAGLAE